MIPNMGFARMTCRSWGNNVTPTLLQFADSNVLNYSHNIIRRVCTYRHKHLRETVIKHNIILKNNHTTV